MRTTSHNATGTQSIDRAVDILRCVGREGVRGLRLVDIVARSSLAKPTVHRMLTALIKTGLLEQDPITRRYRLGSEAYLLGMQASARFGIHALAMENLTRLSQATGDTVFLSVRQDTSSLCLHRQEGSFPIRTHVLQVGDRHPLGVGAGSLAMLAALPDDEVERAINANERTIEEQFSGYSPRVLRALVERTRSNGFALNQGMIMQGSWGIGVAVQGSDGQSVAAISVAAVESRLDMVRQNELVPLLHAETRRLTQMLQQQALSSRATSHRFFAGRGEPSSGPASLQENSEMVFRQKSSNR
jgi:DNA-binding IclR family transcriptional regulator